MLNMTTTKLSFCDNCQPSANRLMDEKINTQKQHNEIFQKVNTEILELKQALEVANKKVDLEKSACLRLNEENERLQDLVTRAESKAEGSLKQTNDALKLANERIKQLEDKVLGLKKNGKRAKTTAVVTGATAMVGSVICAAISRTVAAGLAAFGAGALANIALGDLARKIRKPMKAVGTEEANTGTEAIKAN